MGILNNIQKIEEALPRSKENGSKPDVEWGDIEDVEIIAKEMGLQRPSREEAENIVLAIYDKVGRSPVGGKFDKTAKEELAKWAESRPSDDDDDEDDLDLTLSPEQGRAAKQAAAKILDEIIPKEGLSMYHGEIKKMLGQFPPLVEFEAMRQTMLDIAQVLGNFGASREWLNNVNREIQKPVFENE